VRTGTQEARDAAHRFLDALKAGDPRAAHAFLSDDLRSSLPAPEFSGRIGRSPARSAEWWKDVDVSQVRLGATQREATAWISRPPGAPLPPWASGPLALKRQGGWKIADLGTLLKDLGD